MARICLDLDGVIAALKKPGQSYRDVEPVAGAVDKMRALKKAGHHLIIQTARHMKTCNGNQGLVQARIAKDTLDWLDVNGIPYDEIYFGKPWAHIYIDDNGFRFDQWASITDDASNLPGNREETAPSSKDSL
jgi:capsule biosynthesis phosphatase